jgi:hypothetical protein
MAESEQRALRASVAVREPAQEPEDAAGAAALEDRAWRVDADDAGPRVRAERHERIERDPVKVAFARELRH